MRFDVSVLSLLLRRYSVGDSKTSESKTSESKKYGVKISDRLISLLVFVGTRGDRQKFLNLLKLESFQVSSRISGIKLGAIKEGFYAT